MIHDQQPFQPFLNQLITDAQHGYLLPNALTLAALGASDNQIRKCRPKLEQGKHFLYNSGSDKIRRLFYTFQGLLELSILLGTDRAKAFREALLAVAKGTAIVHRPAGHLVPPTPQPSTPHPSPLTPQPSTPHPSASHLQPSTLHDLSPELIGEVLQLKRDEIELRRSEQETQRLYILQDAYRPQMPAPTPPKPEPPQLIVENYIGNGWRYLDDPLPAALVMVVFIFLLALGITTLGAVAHSFNQRETQIYVR